MSNRHNSIFDFFDDDFFSDFSPSDMFFLNRLYPEGGRRSSRRSKRLIPNVKSVQANLIETESDYGIEALVPGFEKDQITIDYNETNNSLIIEGKLTTDDKEKEKEKEGEEHKDGYNVVFKDFNLTSFYREIYLPSPIKPDQINANLVKGTLYITAPKEETDKKQRITIS